jgi:hypothetical protein
MGFAQSHKRRQRTHIEGSMFPSALTDFTVVLTHAMVPELAEAGGLLDSAGAALSDGHDIRLASDSDGENGLPIDLRGFLQAVDPANGGIEFATKISLTDPVAGNDIYLFYGDDDATTLLPTDPLGQYEAYDDDVLATYCFCDDPATGQITDRTRNQRHALMFKGAGQPDPVRVNGVSGGGAWQFSGSPDLNTPGSAAQYTFPSVQNYPYYTVETISRLTQTTGLIDAGSIFAFSSIDPGSSSGSIQVGRRVSAGNAITVWGTTNSGTSYVEPQSYLPDLLWHYVALLVDNGLTYLDYDNTTSYIFDLLAPGVNTIHLGINRNRGGTRTLPAIYDQVFYHKTIRRASWRTSTRLNLVDGASHITGYASENVLGDVIPYSGNEAAYEAFDSVDGGYYDNHADSPFELQAPVAIYDPASPNTVIRMRVYLDSTSTASEYFWGSGSTDTGQMRYNQSDFIYFRDDSNNLQAFDLRPYKDDSWHDLEFTLISQQATATIDGQPVSKGTANPFTDIITMSVLLGFRVGSPAGGLDLNQLNKMEVWKDGNLIHAYHFEHTNAAGDLGPDFVLDRIGGNHGYNPRPVPGNWKRGAPSILNGFNLYTNGNGSPIPAALDTAGNELNIDVFGEPIEYLIPGVLVGVDGSIGAPSASTGDALINVVAAGSNGQVGAPESAEGVVLLQVLVAGLNGSVGPPSPDLGVISSGAGTITGLPGAQGAPDATSPSVVTHVTPVGQNGFTAAPSASIGSVSQASPIEEMVVTFEPGFFAVIDRDVPQAVVAPILRSGEIVSSLNLKSGYNRYGYVPGGYICNDIDEFILFGDNFLFDYTVLFVALGDEIDISLLKTLPNENFDIRLTGTDVIVSVSEPITPDYPIIEPHSVQIRYGDIVEVYVQLELYYPGTAEITIAQVYIYNITTNRQDNVTIFNAPGEFELSDTGVLFSQTRSGVVLLLDQVVLADKISHLKPFCDISNPVDGNLPLVPTPGAGIVALPAGRDGDVGGQPIPSLMYGDSNCPSGYTGYPTYRLLFKNFTVLQSAGGAYLEFPPGYLSGLSITSYKGTATPSISGDRINISAGTLYDLELSNGAQYPLCEGGGNRVYSTRPGTYVVVDVHNNLWTTVDDLYAARPLVDGYHGEGPIIPADRNGNIPGTSTPVDHPGGNWHNGAPGVLVDWNPDDLQEISQAIEEGDIPDGNSYAFGDEIRNRFSKATSPGKEYNYKIKKGD